MPLHFRFGDKEEIAFELADITLLCVPKPKYGEVLLCVKGNMHVPIARIKLHSEDRLPEALAAMADAESLGHEMARRWNACGSALAETPTDAQLADACLCLRHDFGLLDKDAQRAMMNRMREHWHAIAKVSATQGLV